MRTPRVVGAGVGVLAVLVTGCGAVPQRPLAASAAPVAEAVLASPTSPTPPSTQRASQVPSRAPTPAAATSAAARTAASSASAPAVTPTPTPVPAARPRGPARLSIPSIGVRSVEVVRYTGEADDARGTRIQDRGDLASPRGPRGGVGPGEVGNYIVTGHRTSHGAPLGDLPEVEEADHVLVRVGRATYDYVVTETLWISFRSERDKARQSAPVPGRLGAAATKPMITVSTCATPEDHAAGNSWADELGNPEHRIDKVGVLVDVRGA